MAIYKDVEPLIEWLKEEISSFGQVNPLTEPTSFGVKNALAKVLCDIKSMPTADVVEVVRCKDCVYGRKTNKIMSPEKYYKTDCVVCECEDVIGDDPMIYVPTHFCSYGERRDT